MMEIEEVQKLAEKCLSCKVKPCRKRMSTSKRHNRVYFIHKTKRI